MVETTGPAGDSPAGDGVFGAGVAEFYDEASADMFNSEVLDPTVDRLVELSEGGRALEFAIGTGRVALPLRARGVEVVGIEMSTAMVAQMRAKPGGAAVQVTIGDMASARVDGSFSLVYLVYNTITNLLTQEEQVACFVNAAAHLEPGGVFVIEVGVPKLRQLPPGQDKVMFDAGTDHAGIDHYDFVTQRSTSMHYWITDGVGRRFDSPHRYASPAEYDLMARIAGMSLRHRWADWAQTPFAGESTSHISVWQKTAT